MEMYYPLVTLTIALDKIEPSHVVVGRVYFIHAEWAEPPAGFR
jgi:hypothetical protein